MSTVEIAPPKSVQRWQAGGWLETFGRSFFEQFEEPERTQVFAEVIELLRPSLCDANGIWTADHIRLRFAAERAA